MAIYVYNTATGALVSWIPDSATIAQAQASGQLASSATLAAKGYTAVDSLPALDSTHAWTVTSKTVVTVAAPVTPQPLLTGIWILRFTPQEFQAISASTDATVEQFMYALNHTTQIDLSTTQVINGVNYLVSLNLLTSTRATAVMAVPATVNGP